jgi:hypothetical protein
MKHIKLDISREESNNWTHLDDGGFCHARVWLP